MTRLSACYFCGLALDEPLADYPVVPDAAPGDSSNVTVTLCETCEEKLDRVLEVVDSAHEGNIDVPAPQESEDIDDTVDESLEGNKTDTYEGDEPESPTDPLAAQTGADATDDLVDPDEGVDPDPGPEARGADDAAETPTGDGDPETATDATSDGGATADSEGAADPDPDPVAADRTASGDDGDTAADEENSSGEAPDDGPSGDAASEADVTSDERDEDGSTDDDGPTDDDGSADGGDPAQRSVVEGQHSISALEYNKVMRLLQNREFPVDREEIVTVAANAYGLGRSECAKVIDVAVDRGLIDEADGQLRKPDEA